jgi:ATP-dependent exoDNAse (exonuclease V) beta subunit
MPLVDAGERARIETDSLHETLFVEAGAGTGKTHELVERVFNLVVHAGVRLSAIAAITFTEAAGAELRDRIREAFEKRLAASPPANEKVACEQAMADIDQAAIGTLHGFCLRILSAHPLDVDLPPRVEILDEVASQLAFEHRWSRFVDELFADPEAEELVLRAWALDIEIDTSRQHKASFKDVAAIFGDSWDRLDHLCASVPEPLTAIDLRAVFNALAAMRQAITTNIKTDDKLLTRALEVEESVDEVLGEADPLRQLRLLRERSSGWKSSTLGAGPKWQDVHAARAAVDAVGEATSEIIGRAGNEVLRQLSIRLARFTNEAAEHRRAEGRLDFHDLLVLARRLLRTSPEARAALHRSYERLLLDEFQDTDPIQIEVAVLIATAVEDGDVERPWEKIATEAGRLFFVGDPKQSIYRFRRADIALYLQARDRFAGSGAVVLRQNFRTVAPILEWVNHAFSQLMPTEVPGRQPAYQALSAVRSTEPGADHRVVLLGGARTGKAGELRNEEAATVAATIATLRSDPDAWPIFDRETKSWRPPRWADVTILIPTRTSLRQLEDALDLEDLPYRVATGSLVFDTQEVREALDALRAIDDPGDGLALISALRSPLYACSDVDLFTFHEAGGRWDLRRPAGSVPADHPVVRALDHLRSLAELRWWHEPSALLDRLLRERNAFALAFGSRRPKEVWRRLRFIVDQARAFEEAGGGTLRAFLDWAELQRSEGTRVHEPLLAETDDDAVTILTIHGAKGLEFPITVLSGATTQAGRARNGPKVIWENDIPEVKLSKGTSTDNFDRLADIEAEMDVYERGRLLYVACTRAQDHLVVSTFHKVGGGSYGEWLTHCSAGMEDTLFRRLAPPVAEEAAAAVPPATAGSDAAEEVAEEVGPPIDDREEWLAAREALLAPQRRPRFLSATAIAAEGADETFETDRHDIPWRRGRAGTAIGRAVHACLQFADADIDDTRLIELAGYHAHVEAVPDAVDIIAALVRSALQSPSVQAAHAATRSWRELYVAVGLGERAIEGYIDLLYETPEGLVLVDYKTDSVRTHADADAKVERYALQIAAYAVALEKSTGLEVIEARLVFCRTREPIERVLSDLSAAMNQVRRLVA